MNNKLVNTIIIIGIIFLIASLVLMLTKKKDVPNHIIEINYNEYSEIINKDENSIIILTGIHCTHCKNYKPYVNYVADEYNLTVYELVINNLSYEEYLDIHDKYKVTKDQYNKNGNPTILTPTTIIVRNGDEVDSTLGNVGYSGFISFLKDNEIIK